MVLEGRAATVNLNEEERRDLARTHGHLARVLLVMDNKGEAQLYQNQALSIYKELVEKAPGDPGKMYALATAYLCVGDLENQYEILQTLLDIDPDHPGYLADMVESLVLQQKYDSATKLSATALQHNQEDPPVKMVLNAYRAIAEALGGNRSRAMVYAFRAAAIARLLEDPVPWNFHGALVIVPRLEHEDADKVERLIQALDSSTRGGSPELVAEVLERFAGEIAFGGE